jgi:IgA peptidase M64/peptidase M64-like protein
VIVFGLAAALAASAPSPTPRTLRLDYVHTGSATEERFALDGLSREGPWPGRLDRALDDTGFGRYWFEVADAVSGRALYSRGFSSIYGEWETTAEAKERSRAFHESLRFPEPAGPVKVALKKRGADNAFREVWTVTVDPADPTLDRTGPSSFRVWAVERNGAPGDKVDLLLMGDGYAAAEMPLWHRDARRLAHMLFAVSPFRERRRDFNVWAVDTPAEASGVSRPSDGVYRRSPLRATYDAFASERYVLAFDNKRLREAASAAPYEFVEIAVNERKYGGGGIYNLYATVAARSVWAPYLFVHEFGHHFAGLADEYYTSPVAYAAAADGTRPEPWEANATADPQAGRWKDLVTPGTPLPAPWPKEEFEKAQREIQARRRRIREEKRPEQEMDALFREEQRVMTALLHAGHQARTVGAFEGAMYEARGYYRPQVDCIMFTRNEVPFCAPCRRAIERIIDLYSRPARP